MRDVDKKAEINLRSSNKDWMALWSFNPEKVIKTKEEILCKYIVINGKKENHKDITSSIDNKELMLDKKKERKKRDLIDLMISQKNHILQKSKDLEKNIKEISTRILHNEFNVEELNKPIVTFEVEDNISITFLRLNKFTYEIRIFINVEQYGWKPSENEWNREYLTLNAELSFAILNKEIQINYIDYDENENPLDRNLEIAAEIASKSYSCDLSFLSFGLGQGLLVLSSNYTLSDVVSEIVEIIKYQINNIYF